MIGPEPGSVLPQHRQRRLVEFALDAAVRGMSPKPFRLPNESFKLAFIRPIIELASHISFHAEEAKSEKKLMMISAVGVINYTLLLLQKPGFYTSFSIKKTICFRKRKERAVIAYALTLYEREIE